MSTTELDEVVTLLERILPDPTAYGERLLQQVVLRWAESPGSSRTVVPGEASTGDPPLAPVEDDPTETAATPTDVQTLLASALGACDCWGLQETCPTCGGDGFPGWSDPDVALFQEYVGPAAARLSIIWDDQPGGDQPPRHDGNDRNRQGVNP